MAFLSAGVLTGASIAPPPPPEPLPELRSASAEVSLAAASSALNIPANLLIDLINIPNSEIRALDYFAKAFLFSGPWFVVGPTNVWGVDPGDPPKFMSVVNLLVPFPALNGIDRGEFDQNGLGQQSWFFAATQLPTSVYCDDEGCMPTVPTAPITGIASIDSTIWSFAIMTGQVRFPLFDNWFRVPFSELTSGYTFGPDYPGRVNPAGVIHPMFGFAGTKADPNTGQPIMPWDGMTFTFDPSKPFSAYMDHLMADPSTNPIQLPDLEDFGRALQSAAAALVVAFYPFTAGSFFCPGDCSYLPAAMDYPAVVRLIGDIWPGNTVIDEWLDAYDSGTANVPTPEQIELAVKLKEGHFWSFGNASPPADWIKGFDYSSLAPHFHALWTALGLNPPPLEVEPEEDPDIADTLSDDPSARTATPDSAILASIAEVAEPVAGADAVAAPAEPVAGAEALAAPAAQVAAADVVTASAPESVPVVSEKTEPAPEPAAARSEEDPPSAPRVRGPRHSLDLRGLVGLRERPSSEPERENRRGGLQFGTGGNGFSRPGKVAEAGEGQADDAADGSNAGDGGGTGGGGGTDGGDGE